MIKLINKILRFNHNTILNDEDGFKDMILNIDQVSLQNNRYLIMATGWEKTIKVGIKLSIDATMNIGFVDGDLNAPIVTKSGVIIESIGDLSDNFIKVLSKFYGYVISKKFSKKQITFNCIPLEQKKFKFEDQKVYLKLFYDDENKLGLYSEIYCNVDFYNRTIELKEKDRDYRKNLIRIFTT